MAKTKALISFAITAPLFSHMKNVGFLMMRLKTFYFQEFAKSLFEMKHPEKASK